MLTEEELWDASAAVRCLCQIIHKQNKRWWHDPATHEPLKRNVGELLMLVTSELAEGMEGHRKNLKDDKIPYRPMLEVELVDALIRICDMGAGMELDLPGAMRDKLKYNDHREDHTDAGRLAQNGKKY